MKKPRLLAVPAGFSLLVLGALAPLSLQAAQLAIDPAHSSIAFEVKHLSVATVRGAFTEFDGTIDLDDKDLTRSKANFVVKAASVNTANAKRDAHLKGEDFFAVDQYPEAKFVSTAIRKTGKTGYVLEGDLTIRGVTKKAKVDLNYLGRLKNPMGGEKDAFQAVTEINRRDFGINYGPAAMISDNVKLVIDMQAAPPAAK